MPKRTEHFKNCLGVFQGGGCKSLAFVGAFKEASERGVFFSEVAGTSAGSIIAALVAAGATPAYIEEAINKTNFTDFLQPAKDIKSKESCFLNFLLKYWPIKKHQLLTRWIGNLGSYSSSGIEKWLEFHLRALLKDKESKTVLFRDLYLPLHVIATELGNSEPMVWSSETTPNASVAYAVRCSCTIPVFFQPVNNKFVDGGIVSNLPTFALSRNSDRSYEKILCFTLNSEDQIANLDTHDDNDLTIKEYLLKLVSASIDGAINIQNGLQRNLHFVKIGKLPLNTIDFHLVNPEILQKMFNAGTDAARKFFDDEIAIVLGESPDRLLLATEPEALNQIVREDFQSDDVVYLAFKNTRYVYNIFPTILHWIRKGVNLTFITSSTGTVDEHEAFRRLLLKTMGVNVLVTNNLPFQGALFKKNMGLGNAVIISENSEQGYFGAKYDGTYDAIAIRSMFSELRECEKTAAIYSLKSAPRIVIDKGGLEIVIERLKHIRQYSNLENFNFEIVNIEKIRFLTKFIKSYKYTQIKQLYKLYKENNLDFFECAQITYKSENSDITMPVTPPIAEEHNEFYYLIEGNSRLMYLIKEKRIEQVKLLVVRDVKDALPSNGRFRHEEIVISDQDKKGPNRYNEWNFNNYRHIEEAVRPPSIYLPNKS